MSKTVVVRKTDVSAAVAAGRRWTGGTRSAHGYSRQYFSFATPPHLNHLRMSKSLKGPKADMSAVKLTVALENLVDNAEEPNIKDSASAALKLVNALNVGRMSQVGFPR